MFASKSLIAHLARGVVGGAAFIAAARFGPEHLWLAVVALPLGIVALRGCPMCWTVGLVQTIAAKFQGKSTESLCADGSCSAHR
jgi:hypothetical protein